MQICLENYKESKSNSWHVCINPRAHLSFLKALKPLLLENLEFSMTFFRSICTSTKTKPQECYVGYPHISRRIYWFNYNIKLINFFFLKSSAQIYSDRLFLTLVFKSMMRYYDNPDWHFLCRLYLIIIKNYQFADVT